MTQYVYDLNIKDEFLTYFNFVCDVSAFQSCHRHCSKVHLSR